MNMVLVANVAIIVGVVSVVWWIFATLLYVSEKRKFRRHSDEMDRKWEENSKKMEESIKEMDYVYAERQRRRKEGIEHEEG